MADEPVFLTPEGKQKLEEELEHLQTVRRAEIAEMIRDAKEAGDISENAAYDEAKEQQAFVEGRIQQLNGMLKRAEVIQPSEAGETVTIGCQVTVAEDGLEPEQFRIVGSAEADPSQGRISNASPLGRALLGKRVGEEAQYSTPDGEVLTFKVLEIA